MKNLKEKIACIVLIVVFVAMLSWLQSTPIWEILNISKVEEGVVRFESGNGKHIMIDKFFFDTGANLSVLFEKGRIDSKRVGFVRSNGLNDESNWESVGYSNEFYLDSLKVSRTFLVTIDTGKISRFLREHDGVLGMHVIAGANWLIRFKDSTIETTLRDLTHEMDFGDYMSFNYSKTLRPLVTIYIEGVEVEDVLMDTGAAASELRLSPKVLRKITEKQMPQDTIRMEYEGLYQEETVSVLNKYLFRQLNINDRMMDSIYITEDAKNTLIGVDFLRRFDNLYIDTKNKTFYLFN